MIELWKYLELNDAENNKIAVHLMPHFEENL